MSWFPPNPSDPEMPIEDPEPIPEPPEPPAPDPGAPEPPMFAVHRTMLHDALYAADSDWPVEARDLVAVEELVKIDTGTVGTVVTWLRRRVHTPPSED